MTESRRTASAKDRALEKSNSELSVRSLVLALESEGYSRDEAVSAVLGLQQEKRLAVREKTPYSGLGAYALSPLSIWFWASLAVVGASIALVSVSSGVAVYLRYAFGGALVLFMPGYSLLEALYPRRELDELTRFALSIGLSLALVPLSGLALNYTPFGLRLLPVVVSIAGMTVVFLAVALVRKYAYYRLARGTN